MTSSTRKGSGPAAADLVQYGILGVVVFAALAGAFTHMHDWTVSSLNGALASAGSDRHTPGWIGWANAVISELLPTSSFLSYRKRHAQGRPTGAPVLIFIGSAGVSLLAQLSATGVSIPVAAQFLACLPALAVIVLSKVIFSDLDHAAELKAEADAAAELDAERAAREAELKRERAAELKRAEVAEEAELKARLAREEREQVAELERRKVEAEQAAITHRAEIESAERREMAAHEAAERQADRDRADRAAQREADTRQAMAREAARVKAESEAAAARIAAEADAARVHAEAQRIEAEAVARKAAVERVAAARHAEVEPAGEGAGPVRQRRPRAETQALVDAALLTLMPGATRAAAVGEVAAMLDITRRYAGEFIPEDWANGVRFFPSHERDASSADADREGDAGSAGRLRLVPASSA